MKNKIMRNTNWDPFLTLPDEILSSILSRLPMKDATKTCILSRKWRQIWFSYPNLLFDDTNFLGIDQFDDQKTKYTRRKKFIRRINKFMNLRSRGQKIDSLVIQFSLGNESASHINRWIESSIKKGVEKIDLNFSDFDNSIHEIYEFQHWINQDSSLKHLLLASCILKPPRSFDGFESLTSLHLKDVKIGDEHVKNLLSNSICLEVLSLEGCQDLICVKFAGPSLQLKDLSIRDCGNLKEIELFVTNLVRFEYTGNLINFSFKSVPKLVEVLAAFTGYDRAGEITYALTRFPSLLPQLETLHLQAILAIKTLIRSKDIPTFKNIKNLTLVVFPFEDDDDLYWMSFILNAFPLLQTLKLQLVCSSFRKTEEGNRRNLPNCPHKHLKVLEISGFIGNENEFDLVQYVIENAISLEKMVVNPSWKEYKECNDLTNGIGRLRYEARWKNAFRRLRREVPPTVDLEIL